MRKISLAVALIASIFALPAHADFTAKDAALATITFKNPGVCTSVVCVPVFQLYDGTNVVTLTTVGADAVSNTLTGLPVYGRMHFFNGTTWDRWQGAVTVTGGATSALQSSAAAAKGEGATGATVPSGAQYGGMNVGGNLTGLAGISAGADAISNTNNQLLQGAFNYFYNGTTWDRIRGTVAGGMLVNVSNTLAAVANNADGIAASTANTSPVGAYNFLWNGSTWDRAPGSTTGAKVVNGAADPCQTTANSTARGNITSAATTRIITPSASNKTYICSVDLFSFAANNVGIYEGTGGTCGTGKAGVVGGTTTANGISFAAQAGLVKGGAGFFVWNTAGTNVDFCLETSTAGPLAYFVKYVQAP